jgi:hypothetical protein
MKELENAVLQIFRNQAPVSTGTLKGQVRIERTEFGFNIVSDIYYMQYTEEKWTYNSCWKKTLINPNEGWFKEAFEMAMRFLSHVFGKEFVQVE